jgi:hypothetical protein
MNPLYRIAEDVANGLTKSQLAVPDGQWQGDLFFITNKDHRIIVALVWTGKEWITEHHVFNVQK